MKYWMLLIVFCASCFVSFGQIEYSSLSEKDQKKLIKSVDIAAVRDRRERDDDRNSYQVLCIDTSQDSRDVGFMMRILVELIDKAKNTYRVEFKATQRSDVDSEYTGEDIWQLWMPCGELDKPKVNGYVVQYGVLEEDGTFYPLIEELDDVKTTDEFMERIKETPVMPGKIRLRHAYFYDDEDEGSIDSSFRDLPRIK